MMSRATAQQKESHLVKPVTPADYPYFAQKLQARMGLVRTSVTEAWSRSRSDRDVANAGQVHDLKDEAFSERLAQADLAEISQEVAEIKDIEAAQLRIQLREYGRCLDCGATMDWRRLDAHPTAKRCVACQDRCEHSQR